MGEVYAAKQRLGVDPYVEMPFQMEGAIEVYAALFDVRANEEWKAAGFRSTGRDSYVQTVHRLWEEIQETHLNAADYYLSRSLREKNRSDELVRSASRLYSRYLSFFEQFATPDSLELVPESAYFAAYESARGFGDSYMAYQESHPSAAEIDLVVKRYLSALDIYPFDRRTWSLLTNALERKGQANDYMNLARPIADSVVRSRDVHKWIQAKERGAKAFGAMRRALADDLVLMYLGFADGEEQGVLEQSLNEIQQRRATLRSELRGLERKRNLRSGRSVSQSAPAKAAPRGSSRGSGRSERAATSRRIHKLTGQLAKLDRQIQSRKRALPLYRATRHADSMIDELRAQRDHAAHTLLRKMYHERTGTPPGERMKR
jgi:hypothetical protein